MTDMLSILGIPFLASSLLAALLGVLGIQVVKREIIFVDIAMAQIAAVGTVLAHLLFEVHEDSVVAFTCSVVMIVLAALFFATARQRLPQISLETVIGVTYAVSAGAALFLVGVAPGGHMHVQKLLSGNLLWANRVDLVWIVAVGIPAISVLWGARHYLTETMGSRQALGWDILFYTILGVIITLGVRLVGIVVVFAYLVIPATLSLLFSIGHRNRVLIVWVTGIMASGFGLIFAYQLDFSVGPSIALFLGLELVLVAVIQKCGRGSKFTVEGRDSVTTTNRER